MGRGRHGEGASGKARSASPAALGKSDVSRAVTLEGHALTRATFSAEEG